MATRIDYDMVMTGKQSVRRRAGIIVGRFFAIFGLTLLFIIIFLFGLITITFNGPSVSARNLLVSTLMETSAAKFIPRMYFSEEEIQTIMAGNTAVAVNEISDSSMVSVAVKDNPDSNIEPIEIIEIKGSTYNGKLMIVHDPSRVVVSTSGGYGENAKGQTLANLVAKENAVAGVNAGGFADENGMGSGGQPLGLVIKDGVILAGAEVKSCVIGFDRNDTLIVGTMTGYEALERGMRDAVSFGPVFIVNGKRSDIYGTGGGLNPRTCIGQTADGSVLLLTIDGRQATSLGATYGDCIDILQSYGAINAANLDGGSSTSLYYNGEYINVSASVYGPRDLPTAFVVLPEEGGGE